MKRFAIAAAVVAALASVPLAAEAKGCPPGLVKKSTYCMPPGQARQFDLQNFQVQNGNGQGWYSQPRHRDRHQNDDRWTWERDRDWHRSHSYYGDDRRSYRIDDQTNGLINLLGAFSGMMQ